MLTACTDALDVFRVGRQSIKHKLEYATREMQKADGGRRRGLACFGESLAVVAFAGHPRCPSKAGCYSRHL
jgi:hypothetical protein